MVEGLFDVLCALFLLWCLHPLKLKRFKSDTSLGESLSRLFGSHATPSQENVGFWFKRSRSLQGQGLRLGFKD